MLLLQQQQSST